MGYSPGKRREYQVFKWSSQWVEEAEEEEEGLIFDLKSVSDYLRQLSDQRARRGVRYELADILTLILLAKLGGEDEPQGMAEWLKHRRETLVQALKLKRSSMPHRTTISRILGQGIDVAELEKSVQKVFADQAQTGQGVVVALDGKTLRGTIPAGKSQGVHLLAAYLPQEGVVLMQVAVGAKENEIVAAPQVLAALDLRGKVVVGDAMHTQRALSIQIVQAGGNFVWTAKENQPTLLADIRHLFAPEAGLPDFGLTATDFETITTCNKGHGRLEYRTLTTSAMLNDYLDWPYVQQVFKLERRFVYLSTGQVTTQVHYGLTSLSRQQASPHQLLHFIRTYWGIENGLHYRRDVTLKEDHSRLRLGQAQQVMACLNNLVIGLVSRHGFQSLPEARRKFSALPLEALHLLTSSFHPTLL